MKIIDSNNGTWDITLQDNDKEKLGIVENLMNLFE